MNRNLTLLIFFIFVFNFPLAFSQPGLSISPSTLSVAMVGDEFEIDVITEDFNEMTNSSFSLNWDPAILKVDTFFFYFSHDQLFINDQALDEGKFSLIWNNVETPKPSFKNGTTMLTLKVTAVGKGTTGFSLSNDPTVSLTISCVDGVDLEQALVMGENGTISVGTTSIESLGLERSSLQVMPITPNPFIEHTVIPFVLTKSEFLKFNILNVDGKSIFQYSNQYGEGTHSMQLNKEDFEGAGVYLLQIKTSNTLLTKKLILVR